MRILKWVAIIVFWGLVGAFLHYTLPQHDVVRITDTYEKRVDFGNNAIFWAGPDAGAAAAPQNRDVFFIQTFRADGGPMIYRNEDTGWGWPPYFKFNSSNLQARASDLAARSSSGSERWVMVRHYGWRNELLSIFPNATRIWPVEGPDAQVIPWIKALILLGLAAVFWAVYVRWRRFRAARLDPVFADMGDSLGEAGDRLRGRGARLRRWWRRG